MSPAEFESSISRVEIVPADVTNRPSLELAQIDTATHVLHLAANTSLCSVRGVRQTNILGTMTLLHRLRRAANLRRVLHVSTAHICGKNPRPVVYEDEFPSWDVEHVVEYTRSKAECEFLIENAATDLPIVIARPSVVVGHTKLGCMPSASIFWYYRLVDRLRTISASSECRKDIVPVDYVAHSLATLLFKEQLHHQRYHISAGVESSVSWREMQAAFAAHDGRPLGDPYQIATTEEILAQREQIADAVGHLHVDRVSRLLEPFLCLSAAGVQVFDNARLIAEGIARSPRFTDYLGVCIAGTRSRLLFDQAHDDD